MGPKTKSELYRMFREERKERRKNLLERLAYRNMNPLDVLIELENQKLLYEKPQKI